MDDMSLLATQVSPTPSRPLLGLTVLVVEDSRYACEAMRLLCLRSGARIRRADCLASARRHLQVYRPAVVVADLGLPDGSGLDLIAELDQARPRVDVILATSGDDARDREALDHGADGFIAKPISDLASFQEAILARLPADRLPPGPRRIPEETVTPDYVAFEDDMAHAAEVLSIAEDRKTTDYVAQFLSGVARIAEDDDLYTAARQLVAARSAGHPDRSAVARVAGLVQERLAQRAVI